MIKNLLWKQAKEAAEKKFGNLNTVEANKWLTKQYKILVDKIGTYNKSNKEALEKFKGWKPEVVKNKVTEIPTKYKKPPASSEKAVPIFSNPVAQEALTHFQSMGKLGEKGIPSFDQIMGMNMKYTDKQIFDVLKQYGWKPRLVKKADGGMILPQPKPYNFEEKIEFLKKIKGGVGPKTYLQLMSNYLNEGVEKGAISKSARDNFLKRFTGTISEDWTSAIDDENLYMYEGDYERYPPKFNEGGFTGSPVYFQDKFNEYDFATRYNNMSPKEGWDQMLQDIKNTAFIKSMKMKEGELGKLPPIPSSILMRLGLGSLIKNLRSPKGLYEAEKKNPLLVSDFKTTVGGKSRRDLLQLLFGKKKKYSKKELEQLKKLDDSKLTLGKNLEKFWDDFYKSLDDGSSMPNMPRYEADTAEEILKKAIEKKRTFHAEGGLAGMLGETRSGYQGGGYLDYWNMVIENFMRDLQNDTDGRLEKMGIRKYAQEYFPRKLYEEGGRVGLGEGDTPSEAYLREIFYDKFDHIGIPFDVWKDSYHSIPYKEKWLSENRAEGGRIGFKDGSDWKPPAEDENILESTWKNMGPWERFLSSLWLLPMKDGGRIGFQEGQGIMSRVGDMVDVRNIPYYSGKGLQGLVNSAETLSKLPFAAGELGSKLLQQKPKKEMFMEAIENITPGSWSENVGLTSLVEGMGEKRPDDAKTVGGILGLGTEIAVPTGGAFKAGQFLLNKASKAMGKVKDGKTLNKLVDEKLTDSGQSRRDFLSVVGSSGLMVGLKSLGLGSVFKAATKVKPSDDVVMRLRTFIDDSDDADGVARAKWDGAFDVEGLSKAAQKTLVGIMKDIRSTRRYPEDTLKKLATGEKKNLPKSVQYYDDISPEDAPYILEQLQKAGHKVKYEHVSDMGGYSVDDLLWKFKNDPMYKGTAEGAEKYKKFKEKTDKWSARKRSEYHSDITGDWGEFHNPDVEDFYDLYYGVDKVTKKAEGGRIGLDAGGPPVSPANLHPLQRPMFYQGGLTKTVPPERGPMPQGLQSNIYDGIIRPGVINGRN